MTGSEDPGQPAGRLLSLKWQPPARGRRYCGTPADRRPPTTAIHCHWQGPAGGGAARMRGGNVATGLHGARHQALPRLVRLVMYRLLLLAVAPAAGGAAGVSVSLDLGWRFYRGLPPNPTGCTSTFLTNYTGQQCNGLINGSTAASAVDCEALCCEDFNCQIWQWLGGGRPGAGCWYGSIPPEGCNPDTPWISFANASRADAVPSWAQLDYPDTAAANWSVIDAPHDFIITGSNPNESPYVNDRSLQGQAFIPKTVGVYRKHFQVPADWQGTHIELYVEGMYAFSQYYLNGAPLGTHALGYTSGIFRLDNSSLLYGSGTDNVLAVYVDATAARDTGWCALSPHACGLLLLLPHPHPPTPPPHTHAHTHAHTHHGRV